MSAADWLRRLFGRPSGKGPDETEQMEKENFLVVGLGNPGQKYTCTRHNVGFDIITVLEKRWKVTGWRERLGGLVAETTFDGKRVVLCRPQTYMNESGRCVAELLRWYHAAPDHLLVLVDDIDLPQGHIRIRKSGSAGTHNGLRSIVPVTGEGFPRLRAGIGPKPEGRDLAGWVLAKYSAEDRRVMDAVFEKSADAVEDWLKNGCDHMMNHFNG